MYNPCYQHLYRCLAARATRPGQVLPEVDADVKAMLSSPAEVLKAAQSHLQSIDRLFKREVVEKKKQKVTGNELFAKK